MLDKSHHAGCSTGNNWFPTILLFSLKCFLCQSGLESTQPGVILLQLQSSPFNLNLQLQYKTLQPKACQCQYSREPQSTESTLPETFAGHIVQQKCSDFLQRANINKKTVKIFSKSSSFIFLSPSQSNSNRNSLVFQFHYILFLLDSSFQKIKGSL